MFCYSQYGFKARSIDEVGPELAQVLSIEWEQRDSDTWGNYFRYPRFQPESSGQPDESFILYLNQKDWLESWKNRDHKQFRILMTVKTARPLEIDLLLFPHFKKRIAVLERYLHDK